MKRALILSLVLSLFSLVSKSQNAFIRNITINVDSAGDPLELAWAGGLNNPIFSEIDFNNDGLHDLFIFERSNNRIMTFINTGAVGSHCWRYAPEYEDAFPQIDGWAYLYDYDCDGKPDLFCTKVRNNGITLYRNDSQFGNLHFSVRDTMIRYWYAGTFRSNILASSYLIPHFNDVDGDGDVDIIGQQSVCAGAFAYYKNMSMELYGVCDSIGDFVEEQDPWGKFSLRSGAYKHVAIENGWNITCPLWMQANQPNDINQYEIARRDDTYASIMTIDIDGDGDKDAILGDAGANNSLLLINGGSVSDALMTSQDTLFPSYNIPVELYSFNYHSYIDVDNDGIRDLIVSQSEFENKHGVFYYKNNGTNAIPNFSLVEKDFLQNEMIDVGESATPVFFDYDGDGDKDLVIGNRIITTGDSTYISTLTLYRNKGTQALPNYEWVTNDYAGLQSLLLTGQLFPAFSDFDSDGDEDMLIGQDDGHMIYFTNTAGPSATATWSAPTPNFMSIDVGQANTPVIFDLNKDGKKDLVVGNKNGFLEYFENVGTTTFPFFSNVATMDTLGGILLRRGNSTDGYLVPFLFDQQGDTRLVVSCMEGNIFLYGNIDGNIMGNYTVLDTVLTKLAGIRYGYNVSVSGGDINNDSLTDLLIGFFGGGVQVYYQDLANSVSSLENKEISVRVSPNPASDELVIKVAVNGNNTLCKLFDLTGREIRSQNLQGGYAVMNVSDLSSGVYVLNVISGSALVTKKVVIRH